MKLITLKNYFLIFILALIGGVFTKSVAEDGLSLIPSYEECEHNGEIAQSTQIVKKIES